MKSLQAILLLFLVPFFFISASQLESLETLDENLALDYCLNCKSLGGIEALSFLAHSPNKLRESFLSSTRDNSVFEFLRQGRPIPDEKFQAAKSSFNSYDKAKKSWSLPAEPKTKRCQVPLISAPYEVKSDQPISRVDPTTTSSVDPLTSSSVNLCTSNLPQVNPKIAYYDLHIVNAKGLPGKRIAYFEQFEGLLEVIKKKNFFNRDISCFFLCEKYSGTLQIRDSLFGSLYFSFKVDKTQASLCSTTYAIKRLFRNNQLLEKTVLASYLTFNVNETQFTWTIIVSGQFDFMAQELKRKFAKIVVSTDYSIWE